VIVEAMNAGLPIVTTRHRGSADLLKAGENAVFVPPHDPRATAEAILQLLGDRERRVSMGEANRRKVREFSPDIVGPRYVSILEDIVASAGGLRAET